MSLRDLAEAFWNHTLEENPIVATMVGERSLDHRMPDPSREADRRRKVQLEALRHQVEALDPAELDDEDRVTRGELLGAVRRDLDALEADLDSFNVSPLGGPHVFLMHIPGLQPLRTEEEVVAYGDRVAAMPRYLDQVGQRLREGLAEGRVAFEGGLRRVVSQVDGMLEQDPCEWPLVRHLVELPEDVPEETAERIRRKVAAGVEALHESYREFRRVLTEELLPHARDAEHPGLAYLEGGPEAYDRLRRVHTSLGLSSEEIHALGQDAVRTLREEIEEVGGRALGVEDFARIQGRLHEDPALFFDTPEAIVEAAEAAIRRAEEAVPDAFGELRPPTRCQVEPIPAAEAKDSTIGYYRGPAPDGSRPGTYSVNTHAPETRSRVDSEPLAFHEAVPGHHLQITVAQGLGSLPAFRRHGHVTAYVEGWALYAERLADDLGLYTGDLDRLGMLFFDIKRACRLVIDTGLHGLGWGRAEALEFLTANSLMHGHAAEVEIDRYVVMPGQALSYKLGQVEILKLRDEARGALGDAFTLGAFHDRVLESGAVGLGVLRERVEAWVAATAER